MNKKIKIGIFTGIVSGLALVILFGLGYLYIPLAHPENLTEIEVHMEKGPCFGSCPVYSITVYGNGTVMYEGKQYVRTLGSRTYTIPVEDVANLIGKFYQINYFSLEDSYELPITDLPTTITSIKTGEQEKRVSNYGDSGPARLHDLELEIDKITHSESLWRK